MNCEPALTALYRPGGAWASPTSSAPQQAISPDSRTAHACDSPAPTERNVPPGASSSPFLRPPQQTSSADSRIAHVNPSPALTKRYLPGVRSPHPCRSCPSSRSRQTPVLHRCGCSQHSRTGMCARTHDAPHSKCPPSRKLSPPRVPRTCEYPPRSPSGTSPKARWSSRNSHSPSSERRPIRRARRRHDHPPR